MGVGVEVRVGIGIGQAGHVAAHVAAVDGGAAQLGGRWAEIGGRSRAAEIGGRSRSAEIGRGRAEMMRAAALMIGQGGGGGKQRGGAARGRHAPRR